MLERDYESYKKSGVKASKSPLKDFISLYADLAQKLKSETSLEIEGVKENIRNAFPKEIYFTLTDEKDSYVKFNLTETSKEYIIPIFTDIEEFDEGLEKISKLFLDRLSLKVITPEGLDSLASEDALFMGFVINPHSQNFMMDRNADF